MRNVPLLPTRGWESDLCERGGLSMESQEWITHETDIVLEIA